MPCPTHTRSSLIICALIAACNADDSGEGSATETSSTTTTSGATSTASTSEGSTSTGSGTDTAAETTSTSTTDATTATTTEATTEATTAVSATEPTSEGTDSATDSDSDSDSGTDTDSDTDTDTDDSTTGMQGCPPDQTPKTFDFIYIANTSQNTVSKINTMTGVEAGRFLVAPGQSNASRTSVNQFGDVAVSSRHEGRVTKVAALEVRCKDLNNNGVIDSSTGTNDIRPWGQDECVIWSTPIPSPSYTHGPRATAWEAVAQDQVTCEMPTPRLWVGYKDGNNAAHFLRIDGDSGAILDDVVMPGWGSSFSPYGGAVNTAGDFIVTGYDGDKVVKIDAQTLAITDLGLPPGTYKYGMGVDGKGDVWIGSFAGAHNLYHYKSGEGQWVGLGSGGGSILGVAIDKEGRVWGAGTGPCRLVEADSATDTYTKTNISLPGCGSPWGVSVDNEGYIWVVDKANKAYKVDPDTYEVKLIFDKLVNPYTYSDMTGQGLQLVIPQ